MCKLCKEEVCNLVQLIRLVQEFEALEESNSEKWIVYNKNGDEVKLEKATH